MSKTMTSAAMVAAMMAAPVAAEPVLGFGVTLWFGNNEMQTGIGVRVFSDDQNESLVGSLGLDYILQSEALRPTLGIAYLQDDAYVGLDVGFDLSGGPIQFGAGLGVTKTSDPVVVTPPAPVLTQSPVTIPTGNDTVDSGNDSSEGGSFNDLPIGGECDAGLCGT